MLVASAWLAGSLLAAGASPLPAQQEEPPGEEAVGRSTMALDDVRLSRALREFARATNADIAYSESLVSGRRVFCRARKAKTDELLRCILSGTGLDYLRTSGGTYLIVESVETPPPRGRLAGRVVDASTGEPVAGARVSVAGRPDGTSTDAGGQFSFGGMLPGDHRVVVTGIGYATAVDSVRIPTEGREVVRIEVPPRAIPTEPIIVRGMRRRLPSASLGQSEAGLRELEALSARGTPDVMSSAARRSGVTWARPLAELHVQGGDDGEQVTLLDGAPVRKPMSLGRLLSAFSPEAIERVTVHKSGFGARHGSYTSGVVDLTHDLSRSDVSLASASADPLAASGRAEASWGRESPATGQVMLAARRSLWGAERAPGIDELLETWTQVDPTLAAGWLRPESNGGEVLGRRQNSHIDFSDIHGAFRQELSPFHHFYVSGYHGSNRFGTNVATAVAPGDSARQVFTRDLYEWDNTALQARYEWLAGARLNGTLQLYGSLHRASSLFALRDSALDAESGSPPLGLEPRPVAHSPDEHADEGNSIDEWGARASVAASIGSAVRLDASLEPRWREGDVRLQNRYLGALEQSTGAWEVGGHLSAEVPLGGGASLTAGTRLTYLGSAGQVYAEPRLEARLDRPSTPLGDIAVRLAGGVYRQYVMQSEVSSAGPTAVVPSVQFWMPLDGSLDPPLAYHAAGELLLTPSDRWELRLETYSKWQPRTLEVDYASLVREPRAPEGGAGPILRPERQSQVSVVGEARARGVSLRLEHQASWFTAAVTGEANDADRLYPGRFGGQFVPAPWEEPYRLTADLGVDLGGGVRATGSWRGVWGRSWALRRAYYDFLAQTRPDAAIGRFRLDRPGAQRMEPYSRLDLGVQAEREIGALGVELRLAAMNVLDRANEFDWALDTSGPEPVPLPRTLPGRRLSVQVALSY